MPFQGVILGLMCKEHVVAGKENAVRLVPEAELARGVTGRGQAGEPAAARLQHSAGFQRAVAAGGDGGQSGGRGWPCFVPTAPAESPQRYKRHRCGPIWPPPLLQIGPVGPADVNPAGFPNDLRGQAGVVGVEMGEGHIYIPGVHIQLCQPGKQSAAALLLSEAGIDKQAALPPAEQVAVQFPERVARAGAPESGTGPPKYTRSSHALLSVHDPSYQNAGAPSSVSACRREGIGV